MSLFAPAYLVTRSTRERQWQWAARGGRGRRKPEPGLAWQFLHPKRGRGRPKKLVTRANDPTAHRKRRRINHAFDNEIMFELSRIMPRECDKPVRELVRAMVAEREPLAWRQKTRNSIEYEPDVVRIMRKLRCEMPTLLAVYRLHQGGR